MCVCVCVYKIKKHRYIYFFATITLQIASFYINQKRTGNPMVVQRLRLRASTARETGSIPDWGTGYCKPQSMARKEKEFLKNNVRKLKGEKKLQFKAFYLFKNWDSPDGSDGMSLPAMQETWFNPWVGKIPGEEQRNF